MSNKDLLNNQINENVTNDQENCENLSEEQLKAEIQEYVDKIIELCNEMRFRKNQ